MKRIGILLMFLIIGSSVCAQEDAISRFFNKYLDDERFTSVFVSGRMFEMFSEVAPGTGEEKEMQELVRQLKGLRILASENIDGRKMYREATANLDGKGYEELMRISEGSAEELKFLVKETNGKISELLMLTGQDKSFFLMSIVGNIDLKKLSKLAANLNIQGMDQLKKLNENKQ